MATILIIDDDTNNQRILSYTLRKAGHSVMLASNGQAGLELLRHSMVDLVFLDLSMPVMDGMSFLSIIRVDDHLASLPVIILTASGDDQELASAEKMGIHGFLTKPCSSRTLIETVATALGEA